MCDTEGTCVGGGEGSSKGQRYWRMWLRTQQLSRCENERGQGQAVSVSPQSKNMCVKFLSC